MNSDSTVYKFAKWDTCINCILRDYKSKKISLKYSKPCEFDDIFEIRHIVPDHNAGEWLKNIPSQQKTIQQNPALKKSISLFAEVYNGLLPDLNIDDQVERLLADRFISCFSADWNIPLMWSFYADKYAGCAIGFKKKSFLKNDTYRWKKSKGFSPKTARCCEKWFRISSKMLPVPISVRSFPSRTVIPFPIVKV